MRSVYKGRVILADQQLQGSAVVSRCGFNTYASFFDSIHDGSTSAFCADRGNPEVYGMELADRILCLRKATGSTSAGAVWLRLCELGNAPRALLFSEDIDSITAGGVVIAEIWAGKRIWVVDRLGEAFLKAVKNGDRVTIDVNGMVTIE